MVFRSVSSDVLGEIPPKQTSSEPEQSKPVRSKLLFSGFARRCFFPIQHVLKAALSCNQ